jgi:hypothetical protein
MNRLYLNDAELQRMIEELEEDGDNLNHRGQPIAKKIVDWGWTKFFAMPDGSGFGTIRNTGFAYYESARAFKEASQSPHPDL